MLPNQHMIVSKHSKLRKDKQNMKFRIIDNGLNTHAELFKRHILERIPLEFAMGGLSIELCVDDSIGTKESYLISCDNQSWKITGADEAGLYYGIGKFLHTAKWSESDFTPNPPKKIITPACSFRTIYFSVHNYNWYQMVSIEELERYMEDMLLWGYNGIHCIIPVMNLESFDEELFYHSVKASRRLFVLAKKLGMKTSFGINSNQGLLSAPHEWDADPSFDPVGNVRGHLGRNICPAKPGAKEYLRELWIGMLKQYEDIGLDYIIHWPYDEGGCGCDTCRPWGAKGFADLCVELREEALKMYPNAKHIVSCWIFDKPDDQGEYEGLYQRLKTDMNWVEYLMVDAHADFPRYPLEHDVIKPIINFPEISMWKLYPWGGFGANPMPKRFQAIWDSSKRILSGGMPYSEGIYEDILKIQYIGYYWEPNKHYREILAEYICYEYDDSVVDDVIRIMELIEYNHVEVGNSKEPNVEYAIQAGELARKVDKKIGERAKKSWRWRILFIRAILDQKRYEYYRAHNMCGAEDLTDLRHYSGDYLIKDNEAQMMFKELRELYHAVDYNTQNEWTLPPYGGGTIFNKETYEQSKLSRKNE